MKIKLNQYLTLPDRDRVDSVSHWLVLLPQASDQAAAQFPYAERLRQRLARRASADAPLGFDLPNSAGTRVAIGRIEETADSHALLTLGRRLAKQTLAEDPTEIGLLALGLPQGQAERALEATVAALLAGAQPLPTFKSKAAKAPRLKAIALHGLVAKLDLARTQAEAEGNYLARSLTALPPNVLTPGAYRKRVEQLAAEHGWTMRFFDVAALKRLKAGAFLAVAQGSAQADAGIIHLRYAPKRGKRTSRGTDHDLALVGKGICFDTGGTNLKPARHMHGMHEDMAGSAVALGTLLALTRLNVNFPVDCWLALAQNHIGPNAYKQNDVVRALNGTSIEVVHTDAEGRMVLADTLALASRAQPGLILDYATLTGTCITALGTAYSGAFTNRETLHGALIAAGRASGERVWPFPMDSDFDKALESEVADVKQCTLEGGPDHILAARFLNRFVREGVAWVHIDLAAGNNKGGLAHVPTDITGFGVRFTLNLLLEHGIWPPAGR